METYFPYIQYLVNNQNKIIEYNENYTSKKCENSPKTYFLLISQEKYIILYFS